MKHAEYPQHSLEKKQNNTCCVSGFKNLKYKVVESIVYFTAFGFDNRDKLSMKVACHRFTATQCKKSVSICAQKCLRRFLSLISYQLVGF